MSDVLLRMQSVVPLAGTLHLGHTPMQIRFFKTQQQQGSKTFQYWQHIVQMKALEKGIKELRLLVIEKRLAWKKTHRFWWRLLKSKELIDLERRKALHNLHYTKLDLADRELELARHLDVIETSFADCLEMTEDDIMKEEDRYWTERLGRSLAASRLAATSGLPPGEVAAVLALPPDLREGVVASFENALSEGLAKLPPKS